MPAKLREDERRLRLLAAVASEAAGRSASERTRWAASHLGYLQEPKNFDSVLSKVRGTRGPVRPTVRVSPEVFALTPLLLRIEGHGREQPDLMDAIRSLPGICTLTELRDSLDVLAFCLVENEPEAQRLIRAIRARVPSDRGVVRETASRVDSQPEVATWEALARRQARRMGLI